MITNQTKTHVLSLSVLASHSLTDIPDDLIMRNAIYHLAQKIKKGQHFVSG